MSIEPFVYNQMMDTYAEFTKLYEVLNKAQKEAVDTVEGPVMVIAGPGTGKTTILTLRIANIIRTTDTAPENILALTFTESGASAMRRKLLDIIGPAAYKVHIHTFHGFAEHIIQQYPDYFPRIIGSSVITDAEQMRSIQNIIETRSIELLRPYGDPTYYVRPVLHEIHVLKRENISPSQFAKSIKEDTEIKDTVKKTEREKIEMRNAKNTELAFVYKQYEAYLREHRYYDFDDMLLELIRALESESEFKLMLQESFQYILADEHQDANASQNRILELLSDFHESPNLFIVGDDKQAIYRFQGASLENFIYFTTKYPEAKVIELTHNYRSHQGILDASHGVILNNPSMPGRHPVKLVSLQMGVKPVFVDEFPSDGAERSYVAEIVQRLLKKGERPEEIAIIYRENKHARDISSALRERGIVHRIESDHDILEDTDALKIVTLVKAIHDPSNSQWLAGALFLPELGCDPADVAEICSYASRERIALHMAIKGLTKGGKAQTDKKASQSLRNAYNNIVRWSGEARTTPFVDFLQRLIQETNMLASIVATGESVDRLTSLQAFYDRVLTVARSKKTFFLQDFIEYIDTVHEHGILSRRTYTDHISAVRLMTAHRAKGLEFNHVFILHAVDKLWGERSRRSLFTIPVIEHARDSGRVEDERRLFYVALTRARESVTISYARTNAGSESVPSRFISEINPSLISFENIDGETEHAIFFKRMQEPPAPLPEVTLIHPDFVRATFLGQPLSVTHLNNYLECPWKYFFVNLIRIPQAPTKHQMYGIAIHTALRTFFEAYKEERDMNKKRLIELFRHELERQPMSADDRTDSLKKGSRALEGYYKEYYPQWNRNLVTEFGVKSHIDITSDSTTKTIALTGKLDKIEYTDGGGVVVVDYKTAKPKSRNEIEGKTKGADGNYKRQLVFYKLLLDGNKKMDMKYGEIDFIEPTDRGGYKKERFEVTDTEVVELKKTISAMTEDIISGSFAKKECGVKDCEYCRLGKILKQRGS